jgi:hypothetical protein
MIDFKEFLVSGNFGPISSGSSCDEILQKFGEPEILTPARKSYPTILVYGDLEFRLRQDRLSAIALSLENEILDLPITITFDQNLIDRERDFQSIKGLLELRGVSWKLDTIMSDDNQPVYTTEKSVHLAFSDKGLTRVVAEYQ